MPLLWSADSGGMKIPAQKGPSRSAHGGAAAAAACSPVYLHCPEVLGQPMDMDSASLTEEWILPDAAPGTESF